MQTTRIASLVVAFSTAAAAQVSLSVPVGTEQKLSLAGLTRVAVGDPNVLDARTQRNDELILHGTSPGSTEVLAWTAGNDKPHLFSITVTGFAPTLKVGQKTSRAAPNLRRVAVGDPEVLELLPADGGLVLEGRAIGMTSVRLWFSGDRTETWQVTVVE